MKLDKLTPELRFGQFLKDSGVIDTVFYDSYRPTSALPNSFIEISPNGAIERVSSDGEMYRCVLAVTVNVKLSASGVRNNAMEGKILSKLGELLKTNDEYSLSRFTIFSGRDVHAGYSYKTININVIIN